VSQLRGIALMLFLALAIWTIYILYDLSPFVGFNLGFMLIVLGIGIDAMARRNKK